MENEDHNTDAIKKIMRLKRYEKPEEGYVDSFLLEFHQRQREELLNRSSRGLFLERLGTFMGDLSVQRVALAGGLACAVAVFFINKPSVNGSNGIVENNSTKVNFGTISSQGLLNRKDNLRSLPNNKKNESTAGYGIVPVGYNSISEF